MPRILRSLLYAAIGGVLGLEATAIFCYFFVDSDMLMLQYMAGMLIGAVGGIALAISRRNREAGQPNER